MSFAGLKSHAVTFYEAGKLGHASIKDLCNDLTSIQGAKFEGVLQEFANHAFSLRSVLECLTSGGITSTNEESVPTTTAQTVVNESDDSEDTNDAEKLLSRYDLDDHEKFRTMDVPLPLKNSDNSVPDIGKELGLDVNKSLKLNLLLENLGNRIELWTVGYIRLLKLFKESDPNSFKPDEYEWVSLSIEFGIPLSSQDLCNNICKRIVLSQLLQTNLFTYHQNSIQELRKMLQQVCTEYQATGSTARMFYQRDQPKADPRQKVKVKINFL
ncbi:hypothetical protein HanIR_Chr02g0074381 [Helianthus annuus]|nr:hypothetical protein HanIR_Chr02g0074381 [Helianthus annuus]